MAMIIGPEACPVLMNTQAHVDPVVGQGQDFLGTCVVNAADQVVRDPLLLLKRTAPMSVNARGALSLITRRESGQ